jgi:hypothetical protein
MMKCRDTVSDEFNEMKEKNIMRRFVSRICLTGVQRSIIYSFHHDVDLEFKRENR